MGNYIYPRPLLVLVLVLLVVLVLALNRFAERDITARAGAQTSRSGLELQLSLSYVMLYDIFTISDCHICCLRTPHTGTAYRGSGTAKARKRRTETGSRSPARILSMLAHLLQFLWLLAIFSLIKLGFFSPELFEDAQLDVWGVFVPGRRLEPKIHDR